MSSAEPFDLNAVELSTTVTIGEYRRMEKAKEIPGLAEFIRQRLSQRYITPLTAIDPTRKNGFHAMAISCLLIETMEAFREGWSNTDKKIRPIAIRNDCRPANFRGDRVSRSKVAFCYFFERESPFAGLRGPRSFEFYDNVRSAILHQGETTGGWRVRRKGPLFEPDGLTINATKFHKEVENALNGYCNLLSRADWADTLWKNFRAKMKAIVRHCERPS